MLELDDLVREKLNEVNSRWNIPTDFKVSPNGVKHLAIICDGNRRAAEDWKVPAFLGHRVGVESIKGIAKATRTWGIDAVTFWVWSTENWSRDSEQVEFVMQLAERFLPQEELRNQLTQDRVRFTHLGRKDRLSPTLKAAIENLEGTTKDFDQYNLNLALDYGGLNEMTRAIRRMFDRFIDGKFDPSTLGNNENIMYDYLDTRGQSCPDLVIRTGVNSGEAPHTSGFMPLQTAYSGWDFIEDHFPNITPDTIIGSIKRFEGYKRRFGA